MQRRKLRDSRKVYSTVITLRWIFNSLFIIQRSILCKKRKFKNSINNGSKCFWKSLLNSINISITAKKESFNFVSSILYMKLKCQREYLKNNISLNNLLIFSKCGILRSSKNSGKIKLS